MNKNIKTFLAISFLTISSNGSIKSSSLEATQKFLYQAGGTSVEAAKVVGYTTYCVLATTIRIGGFLGYEAYQFTSETAYNIYLASRSQATIDAETKAFLEKNGQYWLSYNEKVTRNNQIVLKEEEERLLINEQYMPFNMSIIGQQRTKEWQKEQAEEEPPTVTKFRENTAPATVTNRR